MSIKKNIFSFCFIFSFVLSFSQTKDLFDIARKGTLNEIKAAYKKDKLVVNKINDDKASMLILACYHNNIDVALFLIKHTKNINYKTDMGTALMATVVNGDIKIIDALIAHEANLNLQEMNGKTALIYAAQMQRNEIAKRLIDAGADKNIVDNDGNTALNYAKKIKILS